MSQASHVITPMVLTHNEAPNIGRTLEHLAWASQILVVDSFSTDETVSIVRQFPRAVVVQRRFDSFAGQCNFGLSRIETPWVLSLDADYVVPPEFVAELRDQNLCAGPDGYTARFRYCIGGRPLRGTLYPPRTVLYRREKAHYYDDGHGHRVQVEGPLGAFQSHLYHDDRKSLVRWLQSQNRYMRFEAEKLLHTPPESLSRADRIRKAKVLAPPLVVAYCLFLRGGILDGWPGLYYAFQRALFELLLSLQLIEAEKLQTL